MSKARINIRKVIAAVLWLVAGIAMLVVLVAAIRKTNDSVCKGVEIEIAGVNNYMFLDKDDVWKVLQPNGTRKLKGKPVDQFDLRGLEEKLGKNVWVKDADLFFDKDGVLQVRIIEREPIARIFTRLGTSFYIDSSGHYLPLADGKPPVKLPVFTGFPEKLRMKQAADSALLQQVKQLSNKLVSDSFWTAQITQVDINPQRQFELIPMVGNHVILFGDGNDHESKFRRLEQFYQQVLSRTGFDRYSQVNVQYEGQVVAVRRGEYSKVDSIKAVKNIEQLLKVARELPLDTISTSVENKRLPDQNAGTSLAVKDRPQTSANTGSQASLSEVKRSPNPSSPKTPSGPPPVSNERKPKAVMGKKG
ncbi:cell division protein FtsQ/DivIB [Flavihumibacter rivuli]|uniref:cell division protein FtsQ/DivIB n=1 Tax=Flavihumibacter rivuli TaxID=2838156 RepID=UPI001BDF2A2A|nr:cell division protein FtsQ/DivIB [Flavihumibacter rivuli]ULQ56541.1 cell division protein FtsQ/DivIB [Flavihumibacter rivuli]